MESKAIEAMRIIVVSIMENYRQYWDSQEGVRFFYSLEEGEVPFSAKRKRYILRILVGVNRTPTTPLLKAEYIAEIGTGGAEEVWKKAIIELGTAGIAKIYTDTMKNKSLLP